MSRVVASDLVRSGRRKFCPPTPVFPRAPVLRDGVSAVQVRLSFGISSFKWLAKNYLQLASTQCLNQPIFGIGVWNLS